MVDEVQLLHAFFEEQMDTMKIKLYLQAAYLQKERIYVDYASITHYVYNNYERVKTDDETEKNTQETSVIWQQNLAIMRTTCKSIIDENEELTDEQSKALSKVPDKMNNHIKLALEQYRAFFSRLEKANTKAEEMEINLKNTEKNLKGAEIKLTKANRNLERIQGEFISILGIFSALIFSLFGGFDAFKSIFTNVTDVRISTLMITGSTLMIGIIILLFLLLQSIGILSSKSYLACGCKNSAECQHSFQNRYPVFSMALVIFSVIFLSGALIHITNMDGSLYRGKRLCYEIGAIGIGVVVLIGKGIYDFLRKSK